MADRQKGMGRGLAAILSVAPKEDADDFRQVPLELIDPNPSQPRRVFDEDALVALADSIRARGLLQPVLVRQRAGGRYELIAGERRWRAAREAGVESLPALVRDADDRDTLLLALVENVAREQLSAVEEARAYATLVDEFELSLGDVADRVGRSKSSVSNRLRLLELPEEVLWMVARGELTEGHARAVLALPDHDARKRLAKKIVRDGMSVRAAEKAAQDGGAARRPRSAPSIDPALAERARGAAERLTGLPARVSAGKLEIHFGEDLRLEELVEVLESL